jgi:tripartite-type tricarboxylate transporter receptor subunit TctC
MPPEAVTSLADALKETLARPNIQEHFKKAGIESYWGDTDTFKAFVASELAKWTGIIKAAGIEPE